MKYLIIMAISISVMITMFCEEAKAEFTIDQNSFLHAGISAGFGFTGAIILKDSQEVNQLSDVEIMFLSVTAAQLPGLFKEFVMDEWADSGDLAFNAIGGAIGSFVGVKTGNYIYAARKDDTVTINYVISY